MDRVSLKLAALNAAPAFIRRKVMARRFKHEVETSGEAEMPFLAEFITEGCLALDIGANFGGYSYELARLGARVVAFEPNPIMANALAGLHLDRVEVRCCAVAECDGDAILHLPSGWDHVLASIKADVVAGHDCKRLATRAVCLDGLNLPIVTFIKIDVEGAEEDVIRGALRLIGRDRPVILVEIEERHNAGGLNRIARMLSALGYDGQFYRDGWQPLAEFNAVQHQDVQHLEFGRYPTRRANPYINNFLFQPQSSH